MLVYMILLAWATLNHNTNTLTNQFTYTATSALLEVICCMLGPWMILSIRQHHAIQLGQEGRSTEGAYSSVAFRRPTSLSGHAEEPHSYELPLVESSI